MLKKGKFEVFEDINFAFLDEYEDKLSEISKNEIKNRLRKVDEIKNLNIKNSFTEIAKDFNNIEFKNSTLEKIIDGFNDDINIINSDIDKAKSDIIACCVFNNFSALFDKWINHYAELGITNFVLIDNKSSDNSSDFILDKIKNFKDINIDLYSADVKYNCFRACGWRQKIMSIYGTERWYLNVDSDELFTPNFNNINECIDEAIANGHSSVKSMLVDVYSKNPFFDNINIDEIKYIDIGTYKTEPNPFYGVRIYGGPRNRVFGLRASLQKVPLLYYTGRELIVNDHFLYPKELNQVPLSAATFHYKFLPNSLSLYKNLADSGIHWDSSKEYKRYIEIYKQNSNQSMFLEGVSVDKDSVSISDILK